MNDKRDEKAGNLQNGSTPPAFLFVRGRAELTWFYGFNLSAARLQFALANWLVGTGERAQSIRFETSRPLQSFSATLPEMSSVLQQSA